MKFLSLLILGSAVLAGGCASPTDSAKIAEVSGGESYVSLGSNIPKKGARRAEDKTLDLQKLENDRTMNNGTINPGGGR
jgi:hypothetical protein